MRFRDLLAVAQFLNRSLRMMGITQFLEQRNVPFEVVPHEACFGAQHLAQACAPSGGSQNPSCVPIMTTGFSWWFCRRPT